ncbi:MAG: rhomboid family intramembrane serine protease [Gammaproteobacteria bacterium]|nr:rhomboid family intramembrane serine protease [Gammaproteobacteria bacterium]
MNSQDQPDATNESRRLFKAFIATLAFVLLIWVLKLIEYFGGLEFAQFGIYPRRLDGLLGILLAPFIHGSFAHVFANSTSLIVIGSLLIYGYPRSARVVLPVVYLAGGFGVWLFAREAYHIGASGVAFGILFFVLTVGVLRRERRDIALSLIVFLLYGGMLSGIIPGEQDISFESHLSGALIGLVLGFLLRQRDPAPPRKQYSWELEEEEAENSDDQLP